MESLQSIEKALRLVQASIASSGLPVLSMARSPRPSLRELARSVVKAMEASRGLSP